MGFTDCGGSFSGVLISKRDRLERIYPNPAKRLAPDFFFQPQIYRADGESVRLPAGYYTVQFNGGPEYLTRSREFLSVYGASGSHFFQEHAKTNDVCGLAVCQILADARLRKFVNCWSTGSTDSAATRG
jgi:hypothetical protein